MRRMISVWLPRWPIERLRRHDPQAIPRDQPFALVEVGRHGLLVRAVNEVAAREGVRTGVSLSDARAALPGLGSHPLVPQADRAGLRRLARWCGRYGPGRNALVVDCEADRDYGLWIDITGVAHLYGGEAGLVADLAQRLRHMGLVAHIGLADTYGAAFALARGVARPGAPAIAPAGATRAALARLPVAVLRLQPRAVLLLDRLGLGRIGDLYDLPRASLERRFEAWRDGRHGRTADREAAAMLASGLLRRLDEALGRQAEPLRALAEPPLLAVARTPPEPLVCASAVEALVESLTGELCRTLTAAGMGARRLRLSLYRTDGTGAEIAIGTSRACREPGHLLGLMRDRLERIEAGFGIDRIALEVLAAEAMAPRQTGLAENLHPRAGADAGDLLDRLLNRLGSARVYGLSPRSSHIPERAVLANRAWSSSAGAAPTAEALALWSSPTAAERPLWLLPAPEPVAVVAEVPEGAPSRFLWRRVAHRVVRAEGPERLAPEWWRHLPHPGADEAPAGPRERDYYRVEVEDGARYWLFRDGRYGAEETSPGWFMHGLF